jgi:hypothetical protein
MEPASIRYKNPGAMWGKGNPIAAKWGAGPTVNLNDVYSAASLRLSSCPIPSRLTYRLLSHPSPTPQRGPSVRFSRQSSMPFSKGNDHDYLDDLRRSRFQRWRRFVWFCKTKIQGLVIDANTLSAKLHAQADKIKAGL